MTIAAAFRCSDGIVMCADSKEIYPDIVKIDTHKIRTMSCSGTFAFTGASDDADVLECSIDRLMQKLSEEDLPFHRFFAKPGDRVTEDAIKEVMNQIRDECILPFPGEQQPWLNLLIGAAKSNSPPAIYKATPRTVVEIQRYDCIGTGIIQAKALLDRLYVRLSRIETEILAIYIMRLVKKYVPDVDGFTDIISVDKDGHEKRWPRSKVTELEAKFAEFDGYNSAITAQLCLQPNTTQCHVDFSSVGESLERLRKEIWKIATPIEQRVVDWWKQFNLKQVSGS